MKVSFDVDLKPLSGLISTARVLLDKKSFDTVMYRAMDRAGRHARTVLKAEIPKDYQVTATDVLSAVGSPRISRGIGQISCTVPISGHRHAIGGKFQASGGLRGWNGIRAGKRYKITAKIYKSGKSALPHDLHTPSAMKFYGGQVPFRNLSAKKLNGVAFTRVSSAKNAKIRKVVGIAIPQMAMNRSEAAVQAEILETLKKRIEHEFITMLQKVK